MGLEILGLDPANVILESATNRDEKFRCDEMSRRVCLFKEDFERVLEDQIAFVFSSEAVRIKMQRLVRLAGASSFLRKVSEELARPVYATPPTRRLYLPADGSAKRGPVAMAGQVAFDALAEEIRLNRKMALATALCVACSPVYLYPSIHPDGRMRLHIATPDTVRRIPSPYDPTEALALVIDCPDGSHMAMDDVAIYRLNKHAKMASVSPHGLGRRPWVEMSRQEAWGGNDTSGASLASAAMALMLIDTVIMKKHKSQSHLQLVYTGGEVDGFAKTQTTDEESVITATGSGSLQVIDLQADPSGLLRTKEDIETSAAACYGINRDRLNQKTSSPQDSAGLIERTAELVSVAAATEMDLFDLIKRHSASHREVINQDLKLKIDYRALTHRVDRETELRIWKEERSMGIRSIVDDVFAMNPEIATDEEAWEEIERNMEDEAKYVVMRRALAISGEPDVAAPGLSPQENGAIGAAVRNGELTRDDAADLATGAPSKEETY